MESVTAPVWGVCVSCLHTFIPVFVCVCVCVAPCSGALPAHTRGCPALKWPLRYSAPPRSSADRPSLRLLPRAEHIDLRCNYVLSKSASLLLLLIGRCRRWCVMYTQEVAAALSRGGGVYSLRWGERKGSREIKHSADDTYLCAW